MEVTCFIHLSTRKPQTKSYTVTAEETVEHLTARIRQDLALVDLTDCVVYKCQNGEKLSTEVSPSSQASAYSQLRFEFKKSKSKSPGRPHVLRYDSNHNCL